MSTLFSCVIVSYCCDVASSRVLVGTTVRPRVARDACIMRCGALVWSDTASSPRKPAPSICCVLSGRYAMQPNTAKLDEVYLGNLAYIVLLWIQPADDCKSIPEVQYRIFLLGRVVFTLIYRTKLEMQAHRISPQ
ncbi:hypothetical protein JB92DRAFT_2872876 [Gautieria morchelliformis]|nr:hypothetical protein JB92DRAFT_2872876 [Gautieria morchelliformis]